MGVLASAFSEGDKLKGGTENPQHLLVDQDVHFVSNFRN